MTFIGTFFEIKEAPAAVKVKSPIWPWAFFLHHVLDAY